MAAMAWVLPPPNPASKTRMGFMVFLAAVRRLRVSFKSCFSVGVRWVASKNEIGLLYGGLAVPLAIV